MCFKKLATLTLVASMLMSQSVFATAKTTTGTAIVSVKTKKQTGVTTGGVNMRSQANTKSKVLVTLKKSTKLTILKKENSWLKVQYGKKVGYVSAKYVKVTSTPTSTSKPVDKPNTEKPVKKPSNQNSLSDDSATGMSFSEFKKKRSTLGFTDTGRYMDKNAGVYAGVCSVFPDDDKDAGAYFGLEYGYHRQNDCKDWQSTLKNCFNLLLPKKGNELYEIVSKNKVKNQTLFMDGRKVKIEVMGDFIEVQILKK